MEAEIQTPLDLIECDPACKKFRALWSMCVFFTGGVQTMEVGFSGHCQTLALRHLENLGSET